MSMIAGAECVNRQNDVDAEGKICRCCWLTMCWVGHFLGRFETVDQLAPRRSRLYGRKTRRPLKWFAPEILGTQHLVTLCLRLAPPKREHDPGYVTGLGRIHPATNGLID